MATRASVLTIMALLELVGCAADPAWCGGAGVSRDGLRVSWDAKSDLVGRWEHRASILVEEEDGTLARGESTEPILADVSIGEDFLVVRTLDGTDLAAMRIASHFEIERVLLSTGESCARVVETDAPPSERNAVRLDRSMVFPLSRRALPFADATAVEPVLPPFEGSELEQAWLVETSRRDDEGAVEAFVAHYLVRRCPGDGAECVGTVRVGIELTR
jgi:hypothetical protein